jgi:hypothetical protein
MGSIKRDYYANEYNDIDREDDLESRIDLIDEHMDLWQKRWDEARYEMLNAEEVLDDLRTIRGETEKAIEDSEEEEEDYVLSMDDGS